MIEVERKYRVADIQNYVTLLKKLNAKLLSKTNQHDQIYLPTGINSFINYEKGMPIVRIRVEDDLATLTLKAGGEAHYTYEVETAVSEPKMTHEIISALSMHLVLEITKSRISYRYDNLTIALDQVKTLGSFVEVEILVSDESEVPDAVRAIDSFASLQLNLEADSIENERYDVLIEQSRITPKS